MVLTRLKNYYHQADSA